MVADGLELLNLVHCLGSPLALGRGELGRKPPESGLDVCMVPASVIAPWPSSWAPSNRWTVVAVPLTPWGSAGHMGDGATKDMGRTWVYKMGRSHHTYYYKFHYYSVYMTT